MMHVTAEIVEALSFSGGKRWALQLWTDRETRPRGGLTKGKKGGMLVADSIPELLRQTAAYMEQEGIESLADLSVALTDAHKVMDR